MTRTILGRSAVRVQFTPDGSRLVVLGDLVIDDDRELYLVSDLATGDQDPASARFQGVPDSGDLDGFTLSP